MGIPEYQIVWRGARKCDGWYCYVNRVAFVPGHVILAWDGGDYEGLNPPGFEAAMDAVWSIVRDWSNEHKEHDCIPVYFRVNLRAGAKDPKVAIMPYSSKEVERAAELMWGRIPALMPGKGGGVYHLGVREHWADGQSVALGKMSEDEVLRDLSARGILVVAQQMRDLCTEGGG